MSDAAPVDGLRWWWCRYYTPGGYENFGDHYCTLKRSSDKGVTWPADQESRVSHAGQQLAQPTTIRLSS
eukprot:scaffold648343_cov38-Prasinocladus_malaysianus.AAC.1